MKRERQKSVSGIEGLSLGWWGCRDSHPTVDSRCFDLELAAPVDQQDWFWLLSWC